MQTIMPPINTEDGLFHEGNPSQGTQGTIVTALHLNNQQGATRDLQLELTSILIEAGFLPDGTKTNQVLEAIKKIITNTAKVPVTSVNAKTGAVVLSAGDINALSVEGGTLEGQLTISNADFINKNGFTTYTDGSGNLHRQAGGLRLTIADTILTELYYNETAGSSAEVSLHNKYGSTDSYLSLRNDGQFSVIGVAPQVILSNGTIFATDGNVKGSVWDNGYLSNWILSKANAAKDAAIEWANINCARKSTSSLQPTGWFRDATTGLITQWGIVTRSGDSTRVWFPTAFPNACINVQLTLRNSDSGGSSFNVFANGEDGQGFNYISASNEVQAFWEAKGY